jgi:hypothetical protein
MTHQDKNAAAASVGEIDLALESSGMPSYTQMWETNAGLLDALQLLRERLACADATVSALQGDLLQTELIVATATSVDQIRRQLARLKDDRSPLLPRRHADPASRRRER